MLKRNTLVALRAAFIVGCLFGSYNLHSEELLAPAQLADTFQVSQFEVSGNTLLTSSEVEQIVAPFTGTNKTYADVQKALDALQSAYRSKGYTAVRVLTPEQEITSGTVAIKVVETKLGAVMISGNSHHDEANIRNSLPALQIGTIPDAKAISQNVTLANQNPSKQVEVTLATGNVSEEVDAKVAVSDSDPSKFTINLDNTGSSNTGRFRTGIGYQNANLFNRDHVATVNFTTSPGHTNDVKQFVASYRFPIYRLGDSIDIIGAYSDTSSGNSTTVAGPLSFSGKGKLINLRYNHNFARHGEYAHRLIAGLDWRAYQSDCSLGTFGAAGCGTAANADLTLHPFSLTYAGSLAKPGNQTDFSIGWMHNIPGGKHGSDADFRDARPSPTVLNNGAESDYQLFRLGVSHLHVLPGNWMARLALNGQYTNDALVPNEQTTLAGSTAVRGFQEREVARDKGYVINAELYTPDFAGKLGMKQASLRALVFVDQAQGRNVTLPGEDSNSVSLASAGAGLRFDITRKVNATLDVARVLDEAGNQQVGDWRGHFNVGLTW